MEIAAAEGSLASSIFGGYCSQKGCGSSDECPADSRCVARPGGESVCLRTCGADSDCTFCRGGDAAATCSDATEFVDGDPESVCVPNDL